MTSSKRPDLGGMRTETRLTDLQPELRAALRGAWTENGWDQEIVRRLVAHFYDFLGPFVSGRIQHGSPLLGEEEGDCLVVEFHPPSGRDLGAAEDTFQRACELANSGNVPGALVSLEKVVRDFPEVPKYHRNLGQGYLEVKKLEEAEDEFLRTLSLDPRDVAALILLGNLYQQRGAPEKATPLYRRAIELQPDAYAFTNLGAALAKLGDLDGAVEAFGEALKIDPTFAKAAFGLRMALSQKTRT